MASRFCPASAAHHAADRGRRSRRPGSGAVGGRGRFRRVGDGRPCRLRQPPAFPERRARLMYRRGRSDVEGFDRRGNRPLDVLSHRDACGHNHDEEAACVSPRPDGGRLRRHDRQQAHKIKLIFEDLLAKGIPPEATWRRSMRPLGFDIGSKTVPEIAISIVAELISRRNLGASARASARAGAGQIPPRPSTPGRGVGEGRNPSTTPTPLPEYRGG